VFPALLPQDNKDDTHPNLEADRRLDKSREEGHTPALPPGNYAVTTELPGFTTVRRENVRVSTTVRLTIDFTLQLATLKEEVTVIAEAPTVDIKSSETASVTLGDDLLRNIPFRNSAWA